jgi:uncharacterized protein (TIGR02145 family)
LYTWTAASNGQSGEKVQGICPEGWHLPSDEEWAELEINLGMKHTITDDYGYRGTDQGSRMAGHASLWKWGELVNDPSFGYSGLNILPSGAQIGGGSLYLGEEAFYWTSTIYGSGDKLWDRRFLYDFAGVYRDFSPKTNGMCVRCVKN